MHTSALESGDSEELEALFDSIIKKNGPTETAASPASAAEQARQDEMVSETAGMMFSRIGQLTRKLHDTLRELGLDKSLEMAASTIPDAKDRLSYIATLTEKAAERTLGLVEAAQPIQEKLGNDATKLADQWQKLYDHKLSVEEFKVLVGQTRQYLTEVPGQTKATHAQLMEIMMAQDFQDLTGQVIKKIVEMAQQMEGQLLAFLVEYSPSEKKVDPSLVNGPVINAEGRNDIVTSQQQVDDLLESLGF